MLQEIELRDSHEPSSIGEGRSRSPSRPQHSTHVDLAVEHLLGLQDQEGYWWAELEANTTLTSEYVYWSRALGRSSPARDDKCAAELEGSQLADGGWGIGDDKGGELSTSVEAYAALKLCGRDPNSESMTRARQFILGKGGLSHVRVFTRIHLALIGLWPYSELPAIPLWLMMLPPGHRLSIYRMSSWARSCVVPLTILLYCKPVWSMGPDFDVDELWCEEAPEYHKLPSSGGGILDRLFIGLDTVLRGADRIGVVPFRQTALDRAERYILERQDDEGDWGGIFPAMAYSILALRALDYRDEDPTIRAGWSAIERFGIESETTYRMQSCVSPVWDTALAAWALGEAGVPADSPAVTNAAKWLLTKQVRHYGDWSVLNSTGTPGGWSFEFYNRYFPDCDDSSAVILALRNVDLGEDNKYKDASIERARNWVLSMQCDSGGWGAFDVNNNQRLWNKIPFADHGAMVDNSSPDLTGRVLEMLGETGDAPCEVIFRATRYLRREQRDDGSWYGRWGVNFIYGTWAVLSGMAALEISSSDDAMRRGAAFLTRVQNEDGGWGESTNSYDEDQFVPLHSSASQTAWAIMGLIAAGEVESPAVKRGIRWLEKAQCANGEWEEEHFTGTGFPQHFYIRYHIYRNCFPTMALARYRREIGEKNNA